MPKRFTDTEKWKDEWFGSLPNDYRMIWQYLVDSCSIAGVWKKDFRGLNFNCNTQITEESFKEIFVGRVMEFEKFYFIPKFLKFQYPKGLNSKKPAIIAVVNELEKNDLSLIINKLFGNDYLIIKDKDKYKDTVKDEVKDENNKGGVGGILGEMQKLFSDKRNGYKFTPEDLSSIREIGCWLGENKDIMQCDHTKVLTDWSKMLSNIEENNHWKTYTMQQIFKFRAAIFDFKPKVLQMNAIIPKNKFAGRGGLQK